MYKFRLDAGGDLVGEYGGSGPALILIHGWALDRRMWSSQWSMFRRHFTVIRYDRRGFGESACPPDADKELEDLDAILRALKLDRAALLGMSQGGRVAMRFALAYHDKVSALILQGAPVESTPPPAADRAHLPLQHYAALMQSGRPDEVRKALAAHPLMDVPATSARAHSAMLRMINGYRGEDLLGVAGPGAPFAELRDRLSQITAPTLVLTGNSETEWLNAAADKLTAGIPNAQRSVVPGGGHMVNMTSPRVYNRVVTRFLKNSLRAHRSP